MIDENEELKILQYRDRIDDFNNKSHIFEKYLRGEEVVVDRTVMGSQLIEGFCTVKGTHCFRGRAIAKGIPAKNFRRSYYSPHFDPENTELWLSTVGMGT